jgi:hypothetical protein
VLTGRLARPRLVLPLLATVPFVVAVRLDLLPALRGPAPYPPEWQWGYVPRSAWGLGPALLALLVLLALLAWCGRGPRSRRAAAGLLALGGLAGAAFSTALLATAPEGPWRTLMARAASRSVTSYHTVAVSGTRATPGPSWLGTPACSRATAPRPNTRPRTRRVRSSSIAPPWPPASAGRG